MLEELKRSQRSNQWASLPDRYALLRKTLIGLRESRDLKEHHLTILQDTIVNLRDIEDAVEKALPAAPSNSYARFNALLSDNIDEPVRVLAEIKLSETGV